MFNKIRRALKTNLSTKLLLLFLLGGLLLATLIGGLTDFGFRQVFVSQIRPHFVHYINQIHREIGSPPSIEIAKELVQQRPIIIRIFGEDINWASDGSLVRPKPSRKQFARFLEHERPGHKNRPAKRRVFYDNGKVFILRKSPRHEIFYGLQVREGNAIWFPLIAGGLVLLALFGFYRLTRRLFSPLKEIQQGVRLIGEGQLGYQIDVKRKDELGELAARVNQMSLDLAQMMQAKRDMLLALSHELKSPLARSRVNLELLEESQLQQSLIADQKQIDRLIDEVLASEKLHADHARLHRVPTDLSVLVRTLISEDLHATDKVEVKYDGIESRCMLDANQIRRLIRNLLANALYYHREDKGKVVLELSYQNNKLLISVIDKGEGIDSKHIPRLTEAFYRADPARANNTGGLGLGLYLCRLIAEAHGGELTIDSTLGKGTTITVRIMSEACQ